MLFDGREVRPRASRRRGQQQAFVVKVPPPENRMYRNEELEKQIIGPKNYENRKEMMLYRQPASV